MTLPVSQPDDQLPSLEWTLAGVPAGAEPYVLAELLAGEVFPGAKPQTLVHVAVNGRSLDTMSQLLAFFAPGVEIMHFPAWDCMPYDRASPQSSIMAERMRAMSELAATKSGKPRIILTTANAVLQKIPPRSVARQVISTLRKGQHLSRDELVHYLLSQGYRRSGKAMEPGEFALRGSIIDIVPAGMSEGIRLDMFGDDIESIRSYDPLSQLTQTTLEHAAIYPVSEVLLTPESIERFRESYRDLFGAVSKDDPLYESISNGQSHPGMEHWLPLFYDKAETLFDYCPDALWVFDSEAAQAISERQESIRDYYEARRTALKSSSGKNSFSGVAVYNPVPPESAFLTPAGWELKLRQHTHAFVSPFTPPPPVGGGGRGGGAIDRKTANKIPPHPNPPPQGGRELNIALRPTFRFAQGNADRTPFDQLKERAESAAAGGKSTLLACYTEGSRERLQTILMERGFHCMRVAAWKDAKDVRGKTIGLAVLPLEHGFETGKVLLLSEQDVLGERLARSRSRKKRSDIFLAEAANFAEGELVVHKEHGIGRFEGLVTLTVSGAAHDCLKLIYADDDKLFLPVENIEMVSRFGLEEENVRLDKLGGASWQSRKAKLKQRIKIAAEALLKVAAQRLVRQGTVIETPLSAYEEFCDRFPFVETEDQARAIADVLEDLNSGKPMDRLVCGDVGFGKTEVALRAAFVTAADPTAKLQVAVIAPTTLLARQHYRNFTARFEGFPIIIRQLSRMVPTKEQKETHEKMAEGKVDIVIGTHALLSKQVKFKNLGLMIVDEEQHFGVVQKEKLKEMKSDVHVLTLSATPIPRTLQMALTGVRDLSLITTPPIDRLAVRSFVMPLDPVVVREAILREMHRGGKCFIVTPRIKDMGELKLQISELVPEARMCMAHGQMPAAELDKIMNDFYDGKYDILLSTAIIESGLDIPTANTMIIHNAHLFGLSQLYQMRGRVGRGKIRAYAYFLLPHHRQLSKNATRRLEVMQTLDTLGAGFTLASHDMDIRGFGNLVGEEQSGHIREVGIELYQQMLEEAVEVLKRGADALDAKDDAADWSPQINLGISVLIPEDYVGDLQLRLGLYRRVAGLESNEEIDGFAAELVDRFGPMPEEVRHLIDILSIKLQCRHANIGRIDAGPKGAVLSFHGDTFAKPEALLHYVERNLRTLKARPDNKLVFTTEWKDTETKIAAIRKLATDIAGLAV
jgi:transcription-repair coupling factor (superfamily II helicase)